MSLYPYQEEGVSWLLDHDRGYLADGMGLGKTAQALSAANAWARRVLTIAPASALENWRRERATWAPGLKVFEAISYADTGLRTGRVVGSDWDLVILDEAHYCKNARAKRTLNALRVARAAPHSTRLSGTPMPNHPGELWAPMRALWPELTRDFRGYMHWFDTFCLWSDTRYGPRVHGVKNGDRLRAMLKKMMLRRQLADVALDLPPLRVDVSLLPHDPKLDRALAEAGVTDEEAGLTSTHRRMLGEYKAPLVARILVEELDDGAYAKLVVMAHHRDVLAVLRAELAPFGVVGFDGSTPQRERQGAIDAFNGDPRVRVFVAQQTAAGIAINLQAANEIVLVEPAWTPDENSQAIKRIHRIGQGLPCRARVFAAADTLDEAIMRTTANKLRMQQEVGL